ncbi:protein of unknown function [Methanoculleus bourgensis]|uniref:Uncharacterized protein n=1 Tax=Methanoculleus bourgensis TaxID=83986 RepID=A0A0X3BQ62_9EURY|nr:protein of unknown function [Methanoculleus bourgensis]
MGHAGLLRFWSEWAPKSDFHGILRLCSIVPRVWLLFLGEGEIT